MSDFSSIVSRSKKNAKKKPKQPKKVKKISIGKLQKLIWIECKRIIRSKYPPFCFTCGKPVFGSNDHTAHFIPNAACGAFLRYDLRNLRRCCYFCNIHLGGNGSSYYRRLIETEGQEYVDSLFKDKNKIVNARDHYEKLLLEYKNMV